MIKKFHLLYFTLLIVIMYSCKKLDLVPTDRYTEKNYWTSFDKANMVLNTAYSQMVNPTYFFYNDAMSDDAYDGRGDNAGVNSISSGVYDASLGRLDEEWRFHYQGIKTSTTILSYVNQVPGMTDSQKKQMSAEARFLRALHYSQLTTWWGDVPYSTDPISIAQSEVIGKTSHATIISNILKELDMAEADLPVNTSYTGDNIGRISKGAAIALKARINLYESNWQGVVNECTKLIGSSQNGTYKLFNSYSGLFLPANENNSEVILSAGYVPELRTYGTLIDMVPISVGARLNAFAPTEALVEDYLMTNGKSISESGSGYNENDPYKNRDPRLTASIVYDGYSWLKPDNTIKTIYIKPGTDPDKNAPDEYKPGSVSH